MMCKFCGKIFAKDDEKENFVNIKQFNVAGG